MEIALVFGSLFLLMVLGLPVAVCMGLSALLGLAVIGDWNISIVLSQRMYAGSTSFVLLAIPFYIMTARLMNTSGMTYRIVRFCDLLVGWIPGGLGHVNIVGSMVFAGMSGSAVADASGLGMVEIEMMTAAGYDKKFSSAVTAASATIGPIIPPSIPFVVFGGIAGVSVGRLFLGGILPGVAMGIGLMIAVYLVALKRKYPRSTHNLTRRELIKSIVDAVLALGCVGIIMGGILFGFFTPTEAAVVACGYALILGFVIFRDLKLADLPGILWESAKDTARVLFIVAVAAAYGHTLTLMHVPEKVFAAFGTLIAQPILVLLIVNAILLLLGCFMETLSIMLLAVPILLPVMARIGVDPVHFGVLMTLNLMIGMLTPPVGLCLYCVSSVAKIPMYELAKEVWPYLAALIAVLLLITFVPSITVWLPNLIMGRAM